MNRLAFFAATMLLVSAVQASAQGVPVPSMPQASRPLLARDGPDASQFRGSLVFFNYCITCHGTNADGNGRAARLYNPRPANLRNSDKNEAYMKLIVSRGGQAMSRSEFMPPWGEELTQEQIGDVVAYLQSIKSPRP
jgi:mono/diheme cytochrome c family protein